MNLTPKRIFGESPKRIFGEGWIDALPAMVILALTVAFLIVGYRYPPLARQFPITVAWVILALAGLDIASRIDSPIGAALKDRLDRGGAAAEKIGSRRAQFGAVVWLAGFAVLLWLFGVLYAVPLYVFASLRLRGYRPWLRCLLGAATSTAIVWLLFSAALRIELYRGIIFGGA
jgi:hypothetical protein